MTNVDVVECIAQRVRGAARPSARAVVPKYANQVEQSREIISLAFQSYFYVGG